MKIYLAQINTFVGDIKRNTQKVLDSIDTARRAGADLVVFPELTLLGYPPRDLLLHGDIIEANLQALDSVRRASTGIGVIVGYVERNAESRGKGFFNAAALCDDGRLISRHYKTLLPSYDIFDEGHYFDASPCVQTTIFRGRVLAITICEDMWNCNPFGDDRPRLYQVDPVEVLAAGEPDLHINISASPFSLGKRPLREGVLKDAVRRMRCPVIHVNLVGGNDSIIFDGWSAAYNRDGILAAQTSDFREDAVLLDADAMEGPLHPATTMGMPRLYEALKFGLNDYVRKCGFKRCLLGLSGGIDSALVAAIAASSLGPEAVVGVSMPSRFSSPGSRSDARLLAEKLGIEFREIPIEEPFNAFLNILAPHFEGTPFNVAEENIQARIRGVILMALSNKFGWLLLSTGNKSELAMGYCTLYGDMTGGMAVISDVPKTMVYELSEYINREEEIIPRAIIEKPPSAELRFNQKDTDSLPPYDILDPVIRSFVEGRRSPGEIASSLNHDPVFVQNILNTIYKNEYKRRQAAPGLKVTSRAFGEGWRMPIAAAWGNGG